MVLDSTGLKVYGEGEGKVRTHGKPKRRISLALRRCTQPYDPFGNAGQLQSILCRQGRLTFPMIVERWILPALRFMHQSLRSG